MRKILLSLLAVSLLAACNSKEHKMTAEQAKASIIKSIPGLPDDIKVAPSPVNNIYEVAIGRKIFYVSEDGKYMFFGNIVNAATKENLTDKRVQELSKVDWNSLPLNLAIKVVNGNGSRKLVVFSDPDCPYCHMFEKQTAPQLKDTTIYTFLFPLPIHPSALDNSKKIWCSNNRAEAWTGWMRDKKPLPDNTKCDTSGLEKAIKVGTDIVQVEATPTLVLENGQLLTGALPAEQLIAMMDEVDSKASHKSSYKQTHTKN